jgi:hypothetical protein
MNSDIFNFYNRNNKLLNLRILLERSNDLSKCRESLINTDESKDYVDSFSDGYLACLVYVLSIIDELKDHQPIETI